MYRIPFSSNMFFSLTNAAYTTLGVPETTGHAVRPVVCVTYPESSVIEGNQR